MNVTGADGTYYTIEPKADTLIWPS